jgi:protein-tyrosine-phosphatase
MDPFDSTLSRAVAGWRDARYKQDKLRYRASVRDQKIGVLFVSRRGTARSAMASACLQFLDSEHFHACACGRPADLGKEIDPLALAALRRAHIAGPDPRPRSWDEFRRGGAPAMDFVITLDAAVAAQQPSWPGQPEVATWNYPDLLGGPPEVQAQQCLNTLHSLRRRLELLVSLSRRGAHRSELRSDLRDMAFLP